MCFSAMVKQDVKKLKMSFHARIDYSIIEDMLARRLEDDSIKVSKAFEASFDSPENAAEKKIHKLIVDYRENKTKELEEDLFKQKKRLADAERKLETKQTKKSLEDQRIASTKIKWHLKKINNLKRKEILPEDSRIFPMHYAPIIVVEGNERVIKLARYHCRPSGKPESTDFKFNGLYNARRDNLANSFWKSLFGQKHAFFVVESFYENVAKHNFERRKLKADEAEENIVLHFSPPKEMLVACLYDYWSEKNKEGFYSFAAITGEPTPEIAETGHERLIIALQPKDLDAWLKPQSLDRQSLEWILDHPDHMHFEHELAG